VQGRRAACELTGLGDGFANRLVTREAPWMLTQELDCGSGLNCWRRLRDWQEAGIWDLIHFALLDWLSRDSRIDWSSYFCRSCTPLSE